MDGDATKRQASEQLTKVTGPPWWRLVDVHPCSHPYGAPWCTRFPLSRRHDSRSCRALVLCVCVRLFANCCASLVSLIGGRESTGGGEAKCRGMCISQGGQSVLRVYTSPLPPRLDLTEAAPCVFSLVAALRIVLLTRTVLTRCRPCHHTHPLQVVGRQQIGSTKWLGLYSVQWVDR